MNYLAAPGNEMDLNRTDTDVEDTDNDKGDDDDKEELVNVFLFIG